jgi:hypothetical protein
MGPRLRGDDTECVSALSDRNAKLSIPNKAVLALVLRLFHLPNIRLHLIRI